MKKHIFITLSLILLYAIVITSCGDGGVSLNPGVTPTQTEIEATPTIIFITPTSAPSGNPVPPRQNYDTGNPQLTDIWVDPKNGKDDESYGYNPGTPLKSLTAAWDRIPAKTTLPYTGYRIQLMAGSYDPNTVTDFLELRYGTYNNPVIIQAAGGYGTVTIPEITVSDCSYVYLIDLIIESRQRSTLSVEGCNNILIRNCKLNGKQTGEEALRAYQSQYIYIEDSDISGALYNSLECDTLQYGHITGNRIYDGNGWCMSVKGGSAYLIIEGNELYQSTSGGFTAGQYSALDYMVSPWLHYEVYDIKFINNIIHDTQGPGMSVSGGYNILMSYNTLERVGRNSSLIEVIHGSRRCDANPSVCQGKLVLGGWGTDIQGTNITAIPDRNIFIYNNIVYNQSGYESAFSHFAIDGPVIPPSGSNIPSPSLADFNVQIRGNIIWNGTADMPLGVEDPGSGGQPDNPSCNAAQLTNENSINKVEPQLSNFKPVPEGNIYTVKTYQTPDFTWSDAPVTPPVPAGTNGNSVNRNYEGTVRIPPDHPGAF